MVSRSCAEGPAWFGGHSVEAAATENLDSTYVLDSHVLVQKFAGQLLDSTNEVAARRSKKKIKMFGGILVSLHREARKSKNKHTRRCLHSYSCRPLTCSGIWATKYDTCY
jgi:hypothetical protein